MCDALAYRRWHSAYGASRRLLRQCLSCTLRERAMALFTRRSLARAAWRGFSDWLSPQPRRSSPSRMMASVLMPMSMPQGRGPVAGPACSRRPAFNDTVALGMSPVKRSPFRTRIQPAAGMQAWRPSTRGGLRTVTASCTRCPTRTGWTRGSPAGSANSTASGAGGRRIGAGESPTAGNVPTGR